MSSRNVHYECVKVLIDAGVWLMCCRRRKGEARGGGEGGNSKFHQVISYISVFS